ncbi:MAG: CvpA family protein [Alistipes sp.]
MNIIDLLICLVLVLAVWNGWRQGFIVQVCTLAGILAGIWLASRFGATVGGWLQLDESLAAAGGFVTVLLVTVIAVAVAARIVRKLCHFAGFGIPDIVLGIAVSVLKSVLLLSVLCSAFDTLNKDYRLIGEPTMAKSKGYRPLLDVSHALFPFVEWVSAQIPQKTKN